MADQEVVERKPIDVAQFLSRSGPLTVKPMENIMFEIETTSSKGNAVLPNTEQISHQEEQTPSKLNIPHQEVDKASSVSHNVEPPHRKTMNVFPSLPSLNSLGSFTVAQLEHNQVNGPKIEPKYNPGVLQGNWIDERMHPKYKPIHPPPLNTSNLHYRSTYKDAFFNHKLKDFPITTKRKDKSLPPWLVKDDSQKSRSDKKSASNKQAKYSGPKPETRDGGCSGKDPYKGHDLDPFKRRDQYKTGYEYKLDAFQEKPSLWDKYGGRDAYFSRKGRGNRVSHDETAGNRIVNSEVMPTGDAVKLAHVDHTKIQGNNQPESERTGRLHQAADTSQGNDRYSEAQASGMNQRGTNQHASLQQAADTISKRQGYGISPRGRPTDQYSTNQRGSYHYTKPQHAYDIHRMGAVRQIESDFAKMKLSTEYKNNFKATESIAATVASKRNERKLAAFAAARNVSTFAL